MIRGSCLCGEVRYQIAGAPRDMTNCHCGQCRKGHGAAFATYFAIDRAAWQIVQGAASVRDYESTPGVQRSFCGRCGSNLAFRSQAAPDVAWIAAGGLDEDPGIRPQCHIFVGSRAPWWRLEDDGLPRFEGPRPASP